MSEEVVLMIICTQEFEQCLEWTILPFTSYNLQEYLYLPADQVQFLPK